MIQMSDVSKKYGDKFVVSDIDLPISEGKLTAFIGPNGAGKSTLLAMMSRLIPKDTRGNLSGQARSKNLEAIGFFTKNCPFKTSQRCTT